MKQRYEMLYCNNVATLALAVVTKYQHAGNKFHERTQSSISPILSESPTNLCAAAPLSDYALTRHSKRTVSSSHTAKEWAERRAF